MIMTENLYFCLLDLGTKLNINTDFYKATFDKAMGPLTAAMKEVKESKKELDLKFIL